MRYLLGIMVVGGLVCAVNMIIIYFLKKRLAPPQLLWKEEEFAPVKEGFDQELTDFREIIEENLKIIGEERALLESSRLELQALIGESRQCIDKLEQLKNENKRIAPELIEENSAAERKEEVRDQRFVKMAFLRDRGLSPESIAHRLQMGIGEVRLRLALMEKEDAVYESR